MIHSMTKAEVEKAGALLIDTPKEGEVLYPSILLRGTKEKMKNISFAGDRGAGLLCRFLLSFFKKGRKRALSLRAFCGRKIIYTAHGMYGGKDILSAGQ